MNDGFRVDLERVPLPGFDALIHHLHQACQIQGLSFFVIGALARDLVLQHVHGIEPFRLTLDADIAVAVQGWAEYDRLKAALVEEFGFKQDPRQEQTLISAEGSKLDVVPFGGIQDEDGQIAWPPDQAFVMSVVGFEEASKSTLRFVLPDGTPFDVVSLEGLGMLKLIAWNERPHARARDAVDLCIILVNYHTVAGEALYTEHDDLLDDDFDYQIAGARIYGRMIAPLLAPNDQLRGVLVSVLQEQTGDAGHSPLALAMGSECCGEYERRFQLLYALLRGIEDRL